MIERQDGLTRRHPLPGESLVGYIERVIMGRAPRAPRPRVFFEFFEPSYVFAPYVPTFGVLPDVMPT